MSSYFAAVQLAEEGGYFAEFPDLPGCATQGETLEELDAMLRDALFVYLDGMEELNEEPNAPREYADVLKEAQAEPGFQFLTLVAVPQKVNRVRVNISVADTDLAIIDAAAARHGLDRSALLVQAAKRVAAGQCDL